jgi:hypothetical protein
MAMSVSLMDIIGQFELFLRFFDFEIIEEYEDLSDDWT